MLNIGLDIGTTAICGILVDLQKGEVLKVVSRDNEFLISEHRFERIQDPVRIETLVNEILEELFVPGVQSIGISGQMHGIVYLDENGFLASPLYTWQDRRGEEALEGSTYAEVFGAPSGYGLTTHFYNRLNGLIPEKAKVFCTIHDYIAMKLAGLKSPVVHASNAASFGKYDCQNGKFLIEDVYLPQVALSARIIGSYRGALVCTALGDNQASFFGSAGEGSILINVGTGSQVSIPIQGYRELPGLETRPLDGQKYILVGCSLCGGRAFAMVEKFYRRVAEMAGVTEKSFYRQLDKMLEHKIQTDLCFDTRFCGTRTEPNLRACITNLSEDNFTPEDVALSCLYGIARELYDFYSFSGVKLTGLVGSGNGIRKNPALKRVLEETFGCTLRIPAHLEEAAYGACLLSARVSGLFCDRQ